MIQASLNDGTALIASLSFGLAVFLMKDKLIIYRAYYLYELINDKWLNGMESDIT